MNQPKAMCIALVASLLSACGGGGGGSKPNPEKAAIHASAVAGYQTLGAGSAYIVPALQLASPTGSPMRGASARTPAALAPRALARRAAVSAPALEFTPDLNLWAAYPTINGNAITMAFYADAAGSLPAGTVTITLPTALSDSSNPTSYLTYPAVVSIALDVTAGNVPCSGSIQIAFSDAVGANAMTGTNTLTRTGVVFTLDLTLDAELNASGNITIQEGDATIHLTNVHGSPFSVLTGDVSVSPAGWTGTGTLSLLTGALTVNVNAGSGTTTATSDAAGNLDIDYADGSHEVVFNALAAGLTATTGTLTAKGGAGQTATVLTAFPSPLQVLVKDSGGKPVSGAVVTFAAPASGASGSFAGGVNTATSDASGLATSPAFTANDTPGGYAVTATVAGMAAPAPATFALTNSAPTGDHFLTYYWGGDQAASIHTAFAEPLRVKVTDAKAAPVPGITVQFTVPASGASAAFAGGVSTATSDASGIATSAVLTANGTTGKFTVTATAPGTNGSGAFHLANAPAAAYQPPDVFFYSMQVPTLGPYVLVSGGGLAVGYWSVSLDGSAGPMAWDAPFGRPWPLQLPVSPGETFPIAVNAGGEIVGAGPTGAATGPLYWSSATAAPQALANPDYGAYPTFATSISDSGEIVGFVETSPSVYDPGLVALYWASPAAEPLVLAPPSGKEIAPTFISPLGHILCPGIRPLTNIWPGDTAVFASPAAKASTMAGTATLPYAYPLRENAAGTVVGYVSAGSFESDLPATWSGLAAAPVTLPLLPGRASGKASDVNASGTIVGTLYDASDAGVAAIWQGGVVRDLNALIPAGSGVTLTSAEGITDDGIIYGGAGSYWFILVPGPG